MPLNYPEKTVPGQATCQVTRGATAPPSYSHIPYILEP
jgi:hypothetical protein